MKFTLIPFLVALVTAVADMPTNVFQVCRRQVGTLKLEPWRAKASTLARAVAEAVSVFAQMINALRGRTVFATGALLMALLASQLGVADVSAFAIVGIAGTVDLAEVKSALEQSNRLFDGQFKDINQKIKDLEAKGSAVDPLLLDTREKLNKAIEDSVKLNDAYIAQQTTIQKLEKMGLAGGGNERERIEREAKTFHRSRVDVAQAKGVPSPSQVVTVDEYKAYTAAFDRYLRVGEKALTADEQRALTVGTDFQGGYLVTPDKTGQMVKKIFETSDVRRHAAVQAISTDSLEGSADLDEASGGWTSELGTRSDSNTPAVPYPWKIPVHELYSQPKASQKLINDANIDIAAWLAEKVSDRLARLQNTAFVTGSGIGRPRGFASYTTSSTYAWGTPEHAFTGSNGAFGTDPNAIQKLNGLMGLLKDSYVPGSAFFCNRTTKFAMRNLTDASSAGKFVFIPSFQAGVPDQILGAQIHVLQDMATYTTTDALALAYGNMARYYQIVDRQGISVLVDPFTSKPYVIYYTTARVGADVVDFEAMKFLKFGTS